MVYIVKARLTGQSPGGAQRIASSLRTFVDQGNGVEHLRAKLEPDAAEVVFFLLAETARRAEALTVEICRRAMRMAGCQDWAVAQCMVTLVDQAEDLILSTPPPPPPPPDEGPTPPTPPAGGAGEPCDVDVDGLDETCAAAEGCDGGSGPASPPSSGGRAARIPSRVPSARMLRAMNERYVLSLIRQLETVSRADLARLSGLSKPTVSSVVANLETLGLVERSGHRAGCPGRAPTLFTVGHNAGWVLGVDVRDGAAHWAVSRIDGKARSTRVSPLRGEQGLRGVAAEVDLVCRQADITRADLARVVAGFSSAPCDTMPAPPSRTCHASLDRALHRLFGPRYSARRGVEMEALFRYRDDRRAASTTVYVTVESSVDIGVINDGALHSQDASVCAPGPAPRDPDRGGRARDAFLRLCGVPGGSVPSDLERIAAARGGGPVMRPQELAEAVGRGDRRAAEVLAEMAVLTARLLRPVLAIARPGLVVFAGRLAEVPGFVDAVRYELPAAATGGMPPMEVGGGRGEAVLDGCLVEACDLAWQHIFDDLAGV
ncbi:ROK family transcriptional regulator [Actinomadura litoris]|uniref:ROK family transcriptional regulator n=1 Tax=Actinomadura litoris TaxID=2678616 RepID=UPI001FA757B5|nr:ROK family transcriptional regulator [Actinomadura litoris]